MRWGPTPCSSLALLAVMLVGCDGGGPSDVGPGDADLDAVDADLDAVDADLDAGDSDVDAPDADPEEPAWPLIEPGELLAGTADATLDLPVGLPLAAYTSRAGLFGGEPVDGRATPYAYAFVPSAGVQTRIPLHVVWLRAGGEDAVLVKIDLAYAFDGLVLALERSLSAATGVDVTDRVLLVTGHSHSSYGAFSQAHTLFLGHDRFSPEILARIVEQATAVAEAALASLRPAAIGVGLDPGFDPDDRIFRMRRVESQGLVDDFGVTVGPGYKDPNLYLLRIDESQGTPSPDDDEPMAILFGWGMHGTVMDDGNALVTSESSGAVELKLENHFDRPVTLMHFQVDGGDASPAGVGEGFARMESIGELAAPRIFALRDATATATDPVRLEALVRTIPLGRDIRVRRDGQVDLFYLPYDEGYVPDMAIWGDDGVSLNPYDEFTAPFGAALCGEGAATPFGSMGVEVMPYTSCARVDLVGDIVLPGAFGTTRVYPLEYPLWETRSTMIGVLSLDRVPVTVLGESSRVDRVVLAFVPGEPCALFGRSLQWRGGARHGLGTVIPVGYAMDHEGYLMTVEDWMRGGYEPSINVWGPLHGEHILDQLLALADLALTAEAEDPAWPAYTDQDYPAWEEPPVRPEATPRCGSVPHEVPAYLWTRDGWRPPGPQPPAVVRRVSEIAHFLFLGGDPAIDLPTVTLQRELTRGVFANVALPDRRPLTDRGYDMILAYTPDPLVPEDDAPRDHYWLVEWQAVTDRPDLASMAGMAAGRYRFVARGLCTAPDDETYPFEGVPYEVASEPFVVTGEDALEVGVVAVAQPTVTLSVAYRAAARGFRLLRLTGGAQAPAPIAGPGGAPAVTVELLDAGGETVRAWIDVAAHEAAEASTVELDATGVAPGSYRFRVVDGFGNDSTSAATTL